MTSIVVIIPAFNEEDAIHDIPKLVDHVIVVNNNSTDSTARKAKNAGALVVDQPLRGYGNACLMGLDYIKRLNITPGIIVFLDGDYSDYPEDLTKLINPIIENDVDFVVGARVKHLQENGSMTPQQIVGNWLACTLMKLFFNSRFTDLGPFRAIKYKTLESLNMEDKTYGWTVEMQLKILKKNCSYLEVPVRYKKRIGVSKVSGTIKGTIFAGVKILSWIFKYSLK